MSKNFGPLAPRTTSNGGSTTKSLLGLSALFKNSWKAEGTNVLGEKALAQYTMLHPTGKKAYFHMLLDASGSTWKRVSTGDKKRVYKHLLKNFEQLVECGDTLRPDDVIYVWTFNKRTQPLCRVERKKFHEQLGTIRATYKKEFDHKEPCNYKETRLYDAIATVMQTIREEYKKDEKADFFLVPFTDGKDNTSEDTSLNDMMENINGIGARLHTIFITSNMPPASDLYNRLKLQKNEISLIDCEKTEPNEISKAFSTLRERIKMILLMIHIKNGSEGSVIRVADYGADEQDAAEKMALALLSEPSLIDNLHHLRRFIGPAP